MKEHSFDGSSLIIVFNYLTALSGVADIVGMMEA